MEDSLNRLKDTISSAAAFSDDEWREFAGLWRTFPVKRKQIITSAGEYERYLYFVVEGVQRVYYFDEQGREATLVFTYPPSFGGVLDAMLLGEKSRYNYEALTRSHFLRAPFDAVRELMQEHSAIADFVNRGTSSALSGVLERLAELQCYSAEERFRKLLTRSPHILKYVPHKYLANYLGIDPTNFSKFLNRIVV